MNRKGAYTATIAIVAVIIIATVSFNSIATVQGQQTGNARTLLDFKRDVFNINYLLGKTTADAISDSAYDPGTGSCGYRGEDFARGAVTTYVNDTLRETYPGLCSVDSVDIDNLGGDPIEFDVTIKLSCARGFGREFEASYVKTFEYRKGLVVNAIGGCNVIVTDRDSGEEEVNIMA